MNSPIANTENVVLAKTKAPRAPTLSAKYSKFMAFGYWLTSKLVEKTVLTEAQRDTVFENLAMFQSLDEQVAFYEGFLETSCGPSSKAIKKLVSAKNKPPKAPRAKKAKAAEKQDDLIAQLIADVNGEATTVVAIEPKKKAPKKSKKADTEASADPAPTVEQVAPKKKAAAKKSKKADEVATEAPVPLVDAPKKKAAPKKSKVAPEVVAPEVVAPEVVAPEVVAPEVVAPEVVAPEVVAAAPKKKATKKTKVAAVEPAVEPAVAVVASVVDEDIIQTRVVSIADKDYLIDSQNNLYTIEEPHDQVGNYDPSTGNVSFL